MGSFCTLSISGPVQNFTAVIRREALSYSHLHSSDYFCFTLDHLYQLLILPVTEVLEWLRNKHGTVTHSYDP